MKSELLLKFAILALSLTLWIVAVPVSLGRDLSAVELIENALPAKMTLEKAGKSELLSAVCAAVRENRKAGPSITRAAAAAQGEYAPDFVGTVLRCARKVDCEFAGAIVKAAVSAQPGAATAISDAAMAQAPNCEETIQASARTALKNEADRAKTNSSSASEAAAPIGPGASADEGFDPHEQLALVCDDGTQRAIRQSLLADFLRSHPRAEVGSCPATPTPSPVPSLAPSPPLTRP